MDDSSRKYVGAELALGLPIGETHAALQTDIYKELINKIGWALGSTYREPYRNVKTRTRELAADLAAQIVDSDGYPKHIGR